MIKLKIPPDFAEVARGKRTAELAVLYGVSLPTIRVWCKEVGVTPGRLPRGVTYITQPITSPSDSTGTATERQNCSSPAETGRLLTPLS